MYIFWKKYHSLLFLVVYISCCLNTYLIKIYIKESVTDIMKHPVYINVFNLEFCTRENKIHETNKRNEYKVEPKRFKQLTNIVRIKPLSQTSKIYLIRHVSVILIVGLQL